MYKHSIVNGQPVWQFVGGNVEVASPDDEVITEAPKAPLDYEIIAIVGDTSPNNLPDGQYFWNPVTGTWDPAPGSALAAPITGLTNPLIGVLNANGFDIVNPGLVDGRDVSVDGSRLDALQTASGIAPGSVQFPAIPAGTGIAVNAGTLTSQLLAIKALIDAGAGVDIGLNSGQVVARTPNGGIQFGDTAGNGQSWFVEEDASNNMVFKYGSTAASAAVVLTIPPGGLVFGSAASFEAGYNSGELPPLDGSGQLPASVLANAPGGHPDDDVESVSGTAVDLTNPRNPVINNPTAGNVTVVPGGNLAATDAQAALTELQGDIDTLNAGSHADDDVETVTGTAVNNADARNPVVNLPTAGQVTSTAVNGVAATNVDAAIAELGGDVQTLTTSLAAVPDEVIENAGALAGAVPAGAQIGIDTGTGQIYYSNGGNWTAVPVASVDLNTTVSDETGGNGSGRTTPLSQPTPNPDVGDLHIEIFDDVAVYYTAAATNWTTPAVVEVPVGGSVSAATVVFNNAASGMTATNAQAALDELDGRVDTLAAASHADDDVETVTGTAVNNADARNPVINNPTATNVAVTPGGNLAATNTQGALAELQGDIDALNADVADHNTALGITDGDSALPAIPAGSGAAIASGPASTQLAAVKALADSKSSSSAANAIPPAADDGTGAIGTATTEYALEDHKHPVQTAANTPSTAANGVAATNVDAAIAELGGDAQAAAADIADHNTVLGVSDGDTTMPAIPAGSGAAIAAGSAATQLAAVKALADGGGVTLADAISPAADDATGAIGTATDVAREDHKHPAQTAANTPVTASGNLAATNVQAAADEHQVDIDNLHTTLGVSAPATQLPATTAGSSTAIAAGTAAAQIQELKTRQDASGVADTTLADIQAAANAINTTDKTRERRVRIADFPGGAVIVTPDPAAAPIVATTPWVQGYSDNTLVVPA